MCLIWAGHMTHIIEKQFFKHPVQYINMNDKDIYFLKKFYSYFKPPLMHHSKGILEMVNITVMTTSGSSNDLSNVPHLSNNTPLTFKHSDSH